MHLDEAIAHCLSLPDVVEDTPFGPEVLVFKVGGKLFALTDPDDVPPSMNQQFPGNQELSNNHCPCGRRF